MIRETDKEGAVTVCGGGSRARTVYVSKLNHVELQMVADINHVANNYVFLFLYEGSTLHPLAHMGGLGRMAAWYLPGGPVSPASRWAATSNVEVGQTLTGKG